MEQNPYQAPQSEINLPRTAYQKPTLKQLLFSFEGRVPRRVYWGVGFGIVLVYILIVLGVSAILPEVGGILALVLYIPLIWISLAVGAKRWHDRGKSGWYNLVGFIPIVGAIWTLVECGCMRGDMGDNAYGPDPT